ncbi:hypothetical protein [Actinomadura violacea]|nr:hypothetical protein [Actinomadura violacea]
MSNEPDDAQGTEAADRPRVRTERGVGAVFSQARPRVLAWRLAP